MGMLRASWGRLAYADTATDGPAIVLLHGSGCDADDWGEVIANLPDYLRVVTMDFRGHGRSDTPTDPFTLNDLAADVAALLDHLRIDQTVLVGHSLGGMVGMQVAGAHAGVIGLVLLEGFTNLSASLSPDRYYGLLPAARIRAIRRKASATVARIGKAVWQPFWSSVCDFDGYSFLRGAAIPVYEVFGQLGRTAESEAELRVPDTPHIHWRWIHQAGHFLPIEAPRQVAGICLQALVMTSHHWLGF